MIGVCTCDRPNLLPRTVASLNKLKIPFHVRASIAVVDNGRQYSAKDTVESLKSDGLFEHIAYIREEESSIPLARNHILDYAKECKADYIAMLDDDEIVYSCWLADLLCHAEREGADVVYGKVDVIFASSSPKFLDHLRIHGKFPNRAGWAKTAITGNALIATSILKNGIRFDERLRLTGGEDSQFFEDIAAAGGKIFYTPDANIYELMPRAKVVWRNLLHVTLIKRVNSINIRRQKYGVGRVLLSIFGSLLFDSLTAIAWGLATPFYPSYAQAQLIRKTGRAGGSLFWIFNYNAKIYGTVFDAEPHDKYPTKDKVNCIDY